MPENTKSNPQATKSILVTGCAGFIGSNFVPYFLEKYPEYNLVNIDLLTYAGNPDNLNELKDTGYWEGDIVDSTAYKKQSTKSETQSSISKNKRFVFIQGDICDRALVEKIFDDFDIRGVIHFAAESHVDNSIKNPGVFIETNVNGTFTLLDVAYKHWMDGPFKYKKGYGGEDIGYSEEQSKTPKSNPQNPKSQNPKSQKPRFHHISTDEVYGTLGEEGLFTEETPYAPNSPYSASKAGSDMVVRSYHHTYGMDTVITNCSNNYGPKQHDEKLIPTIIHKALHGEAIPIYGDGKNIRDWLYVLDHCKGIDLAYHKGYSGEVYNIGGRNERTNNYIADKVCEILDELYPISKNSNRNPQSPLSHIQSYKELISYVADRAGHDRRYAIDATKIETELGWKADENFETGIVKTIKWYMKKYLVSDNI